MFAFHKGKVHLACDACLLWSDPKFPFDSADERYTPHARYLFLFFLCFHSCSSHRTLVARRRLRDAQDDSGLVHRYDHRLLWPHRRVASFTTCQWPQWCEVERASPIRCCPHSERSDVENAREARSRHRSQRRRTKFMVPTIYLSSVS